MSAVLFIHFVEYIFPCHQHTQNLNYHYLASTLIVYKVTKSKVELS